MIEFENLWAFFLIPLPAVVYYIAPRHHTRQLAVIVPFFSLLISTLNLSASKGASELSATPWQRLSLISGWVLLIIAAAKPMWLGPEETRHLSGRDLMMIVDLSGSMATNDFTNANGEQISRLAASKEVLSEFSLQRKGDRLGLIVFGESAYVQSPFTVDHDAWSKLLNETQPSMAGASTHLGDAIGLGIKTFISEASAVDDNGLENTTNSSKQRVMIVLTDGNDTDSLVPPIDAAKVAAAHNIKIHVVAMGSPNTTGEQAIEMSVIEEIADITDGESFLAMSPSELSNIYQAINQIEPLVFESFSYRPKTSYHYIPVIIAIIHQLIFMAFSVVRRRSLFLTGEGVGAK
ncbi:VWA domain-containing protein [Vibrio kyushuensis]|uniref:VWA domain-containing protein n=1 Tax=Vibrio TaxID=662 RepID=UPI003D0C4E22